MSFHSQKWKSIKTSSPEFEQILLASLREHQFQFFNLYYSSIGVRFEGGFDRTDQVFTTESAHWDSILQQLEKFDLFLLN
nr:hypothetical protein [Acinetobacter sp. Marseille-Q1620]